MSEIYEGIKYKNINIGDNFPFDRRIVELRKWCKYFAENNFAPSFPGGSAGNLSFRVNPVKNNFIITASHTGLANVHNIDFSYIEKCDLKAKTVWSKGRREPSSETLLHYAIYEKRPDINAIFHGHSAEILEKAGKLQLPVTKKEFPYGTIYVVHSLIEILNESDFYILKNHGFVSLGKYMTEAAYNVKRILLYAKKK